MNSIIDRDIAFYQGEAEQWRAQLRRFEPSKEPACLGRIYAAERVVEALKAYKSQLEGL